MITLLIGIAYLQYNHLAFNWNDYGGHHMGSGMRGFGGMGIMMLLFWGLVLVVMVILINYLLKLNNSKEQEIDTELSPIDLLKKRYAKGEIDKAEFEIVKKDLQ